MLVAAQSYFRVGEHPLGGTGVATTLYVLLKFNEPVDVTNLAQLTGVGVGAAAALLGRGVPTINGETGYSVTTGTGATAVTTVYEYRLIYEAVADTSEDGTQGNTRILLTLQKVEVTTAEDGTKTYGAPSAVVVGGPEAGRDNALTEAGITSLAVNYVPGTGTGTTQDLQDLAGNKATASPGDGVTVAKFSPEPVVEDDTAAPSFATAPSVGVSGGVFTATGTADEGGTMSWLLIHADHVDDFAANFGLATLDGAAGLNKYTLQSSAKLLVQSFMDELVAKLMAEDSELTAAQAMEEASNSVRAGLTRLGSDGKLDLRQTGLESGEYDLFYVVFDEFNNLSAVKKLAVGEDTSLLSYTTGVGDEAETGKVFWTNSDPVTSSSAITTAQTSLEFVLYLDKKVGSLYDDLDANGDPVDPPVEKNTLAALLKLKIGGVKATVGGNEVDVTIADLNLLGAGITVVQDDEGDRTKFTLKFLFAGQTITTPGATDDADPVAYEVKKGDLFTAEGALKEGVTLTLSYTEGAGGLQGGRNNPLAAFEETPVLIADLEFVSVSRGAVTEEEPNTREVVIKLNQPAQSVAAVLDDPATQGVDESVPAGTLKPANFVVTINGAVVTLKAEGGVKLSDDGTSIVLTLADDEAEIGENALIHVAFDDGDGVPAAEDNPDLEALVDSSKKVTFADGLDKLSNAATVNASAADLAEPADGARDADGNYVFDVVFTQAGIGASTKGVDVASVTEADFIIGGGTFKAVSAVEPAENAPQLAFKVTVTPDDDIEIGNKITLALSKAASFTIPAEEAVAADPAATPPVEAKDAVPAQEGVRLEDLVLQWSATHNAPYGVAQVDVPGEPAEDKSALGDHVRITAKTKVGDGTDTAADAKSDDVVQLVLSVNFNGPLDPASVVSADLVDTFTVEATGLSDIGVTAVSAGTSLADGGLREVLVTVTVTGLAEGADTTVVPELTVTYDPDGNEAGSPAVVADPGPPPVEAKDAVPADTDLKGAPTDADPNPGNALTLEGFSAKAFDAFTGNGNAVEPTVTFAPGEGDNADDVVVTVKFDQHITNWADVDAGDFTLFINGNAPVAGEKSADGQTITFTLSGVKQVLTLDEDNAPTGATVRLAYAKGGATAGTPSANALTGISGLELADSNNLYDNSEFADKEETGETAPEVAGLAAPATAPTLDGNNKDVVFTLSFTADVALASIEASDFTVYGGTIGTGGINAMVDTKGNADPADDVVSKKVFLVTVTASDDVIDNGGRVGLALNGDTSFRAFSDLYDNDFTATDGAAAPAELAAAKTADGIDDFDGDAAGENTITDAVLEAINKALQEGGEDVYDSHS